MVKSDYKISDIYGGGSSPLNYYKNDYFPTGKFGMTTDPRSANILQEVSSKLSSGVKNIEIEGVSSEIFDSIPKQALKEVSRLSKLVGVDVSLHAPVMNVSGLTQQGYYEDERESSERRIIEILKRAKELKPEGNITVNFHSSEGIPGSIPLPPSKRKKGEEYEKIIAVNKNTGKLILIEPETKYLPKESGGITLERYSPEKKLKAINDEEWENQISQLLFQKERADEILESNRPFVEHLISDIESGKISERDIEKLSYQQLTALHHYKNAMTYLEYVYKQVKDLFSKAYEFGDEHQREELTKISEQFGRNLSQAKVSEKKFPDPFVVSKAFQELLHELKNRKITPQIYVPVEEFALEKSSETFGKAAYKAYKELQGKNVPILVIENPPAGFALSTGQDIKNIVEKSREQFIKMAIDDGMPEPKAREEAEKIIGATWDVGHINMLRKYGYSEKEIISETEKVAPLVKHVHLSDNFGFEHTELPMGMGNVPLKEMMEKLGERGFEAKKIIEAASWWQHFKTQPFQETLEAMGSPLYYMKMAPYWNQASGLYENYLSGYGAMLPQINYETFGAGFSRLPQELGGQMLNEGRSRFSGQPLE
ncbi:MAG: hypothetical protein QXU40_00545 [Candidatus Pacearchaeota archaeon]